MMILQYWLILFIIACAGLIVKMVIDSKKIDEITKQLKKYKNKKDPL